jgi:hypothetical protein
VSRNSADPRPWRTFQTVLAGLFPLALLILLGQKRLNPFWNEWSPGAIIIAGGFAIYGATSKLRTDARPAPAGAIEAT